MRSSSLLRKFGWRQSKGKWIAENHSRPLTLTQAKNALARDLGSSTFDKAKTSGKLSQSLSLIESGYRFDKSGFVPPKGRKPLSLAQARERLAKAQAKAERARFKQLGFKSAKEREKITAYYADSDDFLSRFYNAYESNFGELDEQAKITIQRLFYLFRKARTKRERQTALNELLIFVGFRTGNEPYPAGQTPKSK